MFEKISQAAEQVASSASRREFLGKLGRGALAAAGALAGLFALPHQAAAASQRLCCVYICAVGYPSVPVYYRHCGGFRSCPRVRGCYLCAAMPLTDCNTCAYATC